MFPDLLSSSEYLACFNWHHQNLSCLFLTRFWVSILFWGKGNRRKKRLAPVKLLSISVCFAFLKETLTCGLLGSRTASEKIVIVCSALTLSTLSSGDLEGVSGICQCPAGTPWRKSWICNYYISNSHREHHYFTYLLKNKFRFVFIKVWLHIWSWKSCFCYGITF